MNATTFRRLLALLLLATSLSAASALSLECGSSQVLGRTDYDAFGALIDRTGTTDNSFLYCGERWDANLGFYYLRARYMNPGTGRFWTMDEFEGNRSDPKSLHLYLYVNGNPANGHDPSGRHSIIIVGGAIFVAAILASGFIHGIYRAFGKATIPDDQTMTKEELRTLLRTIRLRVESPLLGGQHRDCDYCDMLFDMYERNRNAAITHEFRIQMEKHLYAAGAEKENDKGRYYQLKSGKWVDIRHFAAAASTTVRLDAASANALGWAIEFTQSVTWWKTGDSGAPFGGNEDLFSNWLGSQYARSAGSTGLEFEDEIIQFLDLGDVPAVEDE